MVVLKDLRVREALNYSKLLLKKYWVKTLGVFIVMILLGAVPAAIIGLFIYSYGFDNFAINILSESIFRVISAYFVVAGTILFLNMDYLMNSGGNCKTVGNM